MKINIFKKEIMFSRSVKDIKGSFHLLLLTPFLFNENYLLDFPLKFTIKIK